MGTVMCVGSRDIPAMGVQSRERDSGGECHYCKIKGHRETECPKKYPKGGASAIEEEKGLESEGSSQEGKGAGYVGYEGFEMGGGFDEFGPCFSVGYEKENEWEGEWAVKKSKKSKKKVVRKKAPKLIKKKDCYTNSVGLT